MQSACVSFARSPAVSSATWLYRVGMGLAALGAAAVAASLWVALGTLVWKPPSMAELTAACQRLLPSGASLLGLAAAGLAALAGAVLLRAVTSLFRELRGHRLAMSRVRLGGLREFDGTEVALVADHTPQAFCAGYLRPRVYLSTGALSALGDAELMAVIAHERYHRRRYDPLRMLVGRVLSDAFFFLPGMRHSSERYAALSEVAADEAAVRETGGGRGLAAALLAFGERNATPGVIGIAAERVDHLMGKRPKWRLSPLMLVGSGFLAAALVTAAVVVAFVADGGSFNLAVAVSSGCMVLMLALPAAMIVWALRRGVGPVRGR